MSPVLLDALLPLPSSKYLCILSGPYRRFAMESRWQAKHLCLYVPVYSSPKPETTQCPLQVSAYTDWYTQTVEYSSVIKNEKE